MFLSRSSVVTTEIRSSSSVEVLALVDLHSNICSKNMSKDIQKTKSHMIFSQPKGRLMMMMMEVFNVKEYYLEFILLNV